MYDDESKFMEILDLCASLSDEYLNILIDNIEVMIENRHDDESEEQ